MEAKFQIFLILLAVLAGTALLARRINVAPAILLLLAGIALAFVPGMPSLELPPELVLLVVLPPLIYSASVAMSWREFKFNLRPIILLAVGCVIFTAFAVAAATHYLIGLPWNVGFLLGRHRRAAGRGGAAGDRPQARTAAPHPGRARGRGTGQRRHRADPLSLRGGGDFDRRCFRCRRRRATSPPSSPARCCSARRWAGSVLRARHRARDPQIEITLSLITPYVAYWVPEHFGGSGVIATVACGLYMSWNGPLLISVGDAAAGHLLLGPRDLSDRGPAVPADRIPDAAAVREIEGVSARTISCSRPRWSPSSSSSRVSPGSFPRPICRGC